MTKDRFDLKKGIELENEKVMQKMLEEFGDIPDALRSLVIQTARDPDGLLSIAVTTLTVTLLFHSLRRGLSPAETALLDLTAIVSGHLAQHVPRHFHIGPKQAPQEKAPPADDGTNEPKDGDDDAD